MRFSPNALKRISRENGGRGTRRKLTSSDWTRRFTVSKYLSPLRDKQMNCLHSGNLENRFRRSREFISRRKKKSHYGMGSFLKRGCIRKLNFIDRGSVKSEMGKLKMIKFIPVTISPVCRSLAINEDYIPPAIFNRVYVRKRERTWRKLN